MVKWTRRNGKESTVEVTGVQCFSNIYDGGIALAWAGDIGFGEYELTFKDGEITARSEGMDNSNDLRFLKALIEDMLSKVVVSD